MLTGLRAGSSGQQGAALWAAGGAAELGPAARPLVAALLPLLDDPMLCPVAAQALVRIDPESPGGLPAAARDRLRYLAERDQRIIRWHIGSDEILRAEIRHLLH